MRFVFHDGEPCVIDGVKEGKRVVDRGGELLAVKHVGHDHLQEDFMRDHEDAFFFSFRDVLEQFSGAHFQVGEIFFIGVSPAVVMKTFIDQVHDLFCFGLCFGMPDDLAWIPALDEELGEFDRQAELFRDNSSCLPRTLKRGGEDDLGPSSFSREFFRGKLCLCLAELGERAARPLADTLPIELALPMPYEID